MQTLRPAHSLRARAARPEKKISRAADLPHVRPQTFGCGSAIASSSYTTEWLKGKTVDECATIKNSDIAKHLKLPPVKLHCSMLAEDAVKMAIKDFQSKQQQLDGAEPAPEPVAAHSH